VFSRRVKRSEMDVKKQRKRRPCLFAIFHGQATKVNWPLPMVMELNIQKIVFGGANLVSGEEWGGKRQEVKRNFCSGRNESINDHQRRERQEELWGRHEKGGVKAGEKVTKKRGKVNVQGGIGTLAEAYGGRMLAERRPSQRTPLGESIWEGRKKEEGDSFKRGGEMKK